MPRVPGQRFVVEIGATIGQWSVLREGERAPADVSRRRKHRYVCRCSCGIEALVQATNLRSGGSTRCSTCYHRSRVVPLEVRFEAMVDRSAGPDGCHVWTGALTNGGYGNIIGDKVDGEKRVWIGAHRIAWERANGRSLAPGMEACHTCDNPPCVNPKHLFEGTSKDNGEDMVAKKRQSNGVEHSEAIIEGLRRHGRPTRAR